MLSPATLEEISRSLRVGRKHFSKIKDCEDQTITSLLLRMMERNIHPTEITFIQRRDQKRVDLLVGFSALNLTPQLTSDIQQVIREMNAESEGEITVKAEFQGIPRDGEFLLYNSYQSLTIVTDASNGRANFPNIRLAMEAVLTLENTPFTDPTSVFTVLSIYAGRCLESGYLTWTKSCLAQCESLLEMVIEEGGLAISEANGIAEMIELLGIMYEKLDEPERSMEIGLKYAYAVNKSVDKHAINQRLAQWMEQSQAQEQGERDLSNIVHRLKLKWRKKGADRAA